MFVDEQGGRRRFCGYGVFGPLLATCVKCLIDSGCLFWLMATRVKPSIGGIGLS